MEERITLKFIYDALEEYIRKTKKDGISVWNEWLAWCCKVFEWDKINRAGGLIQRFEECQRDNEYFFRAMLGWFEVTYREIRMKGAYDAFGYLYEEFYQSSHKSNSLGQFFTPMGICELMAESILGDKCTKPSEEVVTYNDCACGSGRTLLAAWERADKYNRNFFVAGDVDTTSVQMCALNFMIHGMVGAVEKKDTLTQEFFYAYIVNSCKVPYANNFACLQYYDDEVEYNKALKVLEHHLKNWNCIKYRPKSEDASIEQTTISKTQETAPQPNKTTKSEPVQLSLFS